MVLDVGYKDYSMVRIIYNIFLEIQACSLRIPGQDGCPKGL
jgi:hypothetical protein